MRVLLCVYVPTGLWSILLIITSVTAYNLMGKRYPVLQITQSLTLHFTDLSSIASLDKVSELAALVNLQIPGNTIFTTFPVPFMEVTPIETSLT